MLPLIENSMKRILICLVLLFCVVKTFGQDFGEKRRYLLWTFHTYNTTINGISVGAFPNFNNERFVRTNGIRLELPGLGFLAFIANGSMIRTGETDEIINGLNISSGTIGNVKYNGITLGGVVQCGTHNNGLAIAGMWNAMERSNGIQISGLLNESTYSNGLQISLSNSTQQMNGIQLGATNYSEVKMTGIQIGLYNFSQNTFGIQLGLWNVNEKRKFPIINWNFKRRKK